MSTLGWVAVGMVVWLLIFVWTCLLLHRRSGAFDDLDRERVGTSPVESAARAVSERPNRCEAIIFPRRFDGDGSRAQRLAEERKDGHR